MRFAFEPPPQASAAIKGDSVRFPIRRIFCVGRNYADHVREMGADPKSEPPVFFCKPADAAVDGGAIAYALNTANLHHEVELVVAIGKAGAEIGEAAALGHVWGYGAGCDLTRRDRQAEAKKAGTPWDVAKAFDQSAPLGPLTRAAEWDAGQSGRIWLSVNGETRQQADISEMIWSVPEIVAALSRSWALKAGDLIFTGTPQGVGPLVRGDQVACGVEGLEPLSFEIR